MDLFAKMGQGASAQAASFESMLLNLVLAVTLATIIAAHPWRKLLGISAPMREMVHAQVLIAVAGAIAVMVVGDSLARAFGLVGLGGFIRFRTGIRDPRDAAIFFLLIGLGMACGVGVYGAAMIGGAFIVAVLVVMDLLSRGRESSYLRMTLECSDPRGAVGPARAAIESFPVKIRAASLKLEGREVRFDIENPNGVPPQEMVSAVVERAKTLVVSVHYESLDSLKGSIV